VPEPSAFEFEFHIEKLKNHKSPGIDQIPEELIQAGVEKFNVRYIYIYSVWNKEELPEEWKESIIVHIYNKGDKTDS
jgi:hypothetical protein